MSGDKRKKLRSYAVIAVIIAIASCLTVPASGQPAESHDAKNDIVNKFHHAFYNDRNTWHKNHWLGIQTWQNPLDVWITQEIIHETQPDFIIESGTYKGGSALIWAMVLEQVNPEGKVITIDVNKPFPDFFEKKIAKERIEFILGSSTDPKIVDTISKRVAGKKALVILDSNHKKDHVLKELNAYSPMIHVGGYLIVQDSNINGHPAFNKYGPGPMEAIQDFMQGRDDFTIDKSRERLLLTFNPNGFLKRVK